MRLICYGMGKAAPCQTRHFLQSGAENSVGYVEYAG